jgi:hypothetical protein
MLRSYAAAASLHAGEVHVTTTENAVMVMTGGRQLEMHFDPASNRVHWTRLARSGEPVSGSLTIEPEGRVNINGVSCDLDHAAIDLIASVTAEGKGSR